MKKLLLFIGFVAQLLVARSQVATLVNEDSALLNNNKPDSLSFLVAKAPTEKKIFFRAAGTLLLVEAIPLTFNRYLAKEDFAKVSFKNFFNHIPLHSWEFDDDKFTTNQFAHPYHGNLYFNSFRSNGYTFWQSAGASFAGSLLWELGGETQAPAPNDLINTTFGGMVLGEMTHRIANKILFPKKARRNKRTRELTAFLLNPVNGFTRAVSGKWSSSYQPPVYRDPAILVGTFDGGFRRVDTKSDNVLDKGKNQVFARLSLLYMDSTASLNTPFREFYVRAELGNDDSSKLNNVSVYGSLAGWNLAAGEHSAHRLMLTANYDMIHNSSFYYGGQSVNLNWVSSYDFLNGAKFTGIVGAGPVLLAAVPDQYLQYGAFRRYDYASGASVVANLAVNWKSKFQSDLVYRGAIVQTINGISHSHYILNMASISGGYRFCEQLSLNAEYARFMLHGRFRDYPDFVKIYPMFRVFLRYNLIR